MKIPIKMKFGLLGEKRYILRNKDESVIFDSGWSPNLITNLGLDNFVSGSNWATKWSLGSGTTIPQVTDTALASFLFEMTTQTGTPGEKTNSGFPDYILSHTTSRRWDAGEGSGTVGEFGLGIGDLGTELAIRTLVTPQVTKSNDQVLDFFYRMTATPNLTEQTGSIVDVPQSGGPTEFFYKAIMSQADINPLNFSLINGLFVESGTTTVYDGDIGTITENPSGSGNTSNDAFGLSAVAGVRTYRAPISVDDGNFGTGIRSLKSTWAFMSAGGGGMQIQFGDAPGATGNAIIKTGNQKIDFDMSLTITRS